jgi:two-component system, NarL family, sensor kinase
VSEATGELGGGSWSGRLARSARSPGPVWVLTVLIAVLEFATPPRVVFGYLYVIPLLLGAPQRGRREALGFLALCCGLTLLNLVLPESAEPWAPVLIDRLLVCLALGVTTELCLRNRRLLSQQLTLEVRLAQTDLRRDMIATLAHDLKTPVLGTIATARMLALDAAGAEGSLMGRGITAILNSQQRGLRLIEDLLQIFRADADGLRLQLQDCDLQALTGEVVERVQPIAHERDVTLIREQTVQRDPLRLVCDPALLQRLMENLLLNAIAHSLRGERVWIALEPRPGQLLISVSDSGRGIPEATLPHLFERFYQADPDHRGSGLGLYLCRQIVEAHGGSIRACNLPSGGACLEVLLPAEGAAD